MGERCVLRRVGGDVFGGPIRLVRGVIKIARFLGEGVSTGNKGPRERALGIVPTGSKGPCCISSRNRC